ncbi:hypothetical protein [Lichenicola sp.]|uniref:hypothetical protein n=1 Tax=Lichenicola sp. TaxID=2804529 RepID=UPI003B007E42
MAIDYYEEAREISGSIHEIGLNEEGKTLDDALKCGSTSTEILMALRYHLQRIVGDTRLPEELRGRCTALIEDINSVLS